MKIKMMIAAAGLAVAIGSAAAPASADEFRAWTYGPPTNHDRIETMMRKWNAFDQRQRDMRRTDRVYAIRDANRPVYAARTDYPTNPGY